MTPEQRRQVIIDHAKDLHQMASDEDYSVIAIQTLSIVAWVAIIIFVSYITYSYYGDAKVLWAIGAVLISAIAISRSRQKTLHTIENILIQHGKM